MKNTILKSLILIIALSLLVLSTQLTSVKPVYELAELPGVMQLD